MNSIPVFITNRDLLESTKKQVEFFQQCEGVGEITIVDCDSSYKPLLEWYRTKPCRIRYTDNAGSQAPWLRGFVPTVGEYVVTDPDIDFTGVPLDLLLRMRDTISNPDLKKVGVSLRTLDIPDEYPLKDKVQKWEAQFWLKAYGEQDFLAAVDTTAAMYPSGKGWGGYDPAVRLGGQYAAKHLPWYFTPGKVPEDFRHYLRRIDPKMTHWSASLLALLE